MNVELLQPGPLRSTAVDPDRATLADDLELHHLFDAMAADDSYIRDVARIVITAPSSDAAVLAHRHAVLADCLENPDAIREIYDIASEAVGVSRWGSVKIRLTLEPLEALVGYLRRLRTACDRYRGVDFRSDGFAALFATVATQLDDEYLSGIEARLRELDSPDGFLISAGLGTGNKARDFGLHQPPTRSRTLFGTQRRHGLVFEVPGNDEDSLRALAELSGRGTRPVADAVFEAADHVQRFFRTLRAESAFYVGCLNLAAQLSDSGPITMPDTGPVGHPTLRCRGLRDVGLSLRSPAGVVGNDVDADGKSLIVVTGANNGGKSTFLRSLGTAQLMMQAGMFVAAESFTADMRDGVVTLFQREEDSAMRHGRLDEELSRMRVISDRIRPGSMLLCNEPFASTNDREGSRIAEPIVAALTEIGVKIVFVTHLFDFTYRRHRSEHDGDLFLRAERTADGTRTFRIEPGAPQPTSYGRDTFRRVFGD